MALLNKVNELLVLRRELQILQVLHPYCKKENKNKSSSSRLPRAKDRAETQPSQPSALLPYFTKHFGREA